ncbi:dimethyladenosine transferase 2-like isoform X3, partial [Leptotrombidium deliense]
LMFLKKITRGVFKPRSFQCMCCTHDAQVKLGRKLQKKPWAHSASRVHIADEQVAEMLAKTITKDIRNDSIIFEANPGPGILTKALLENGAQRLRIFVPKESDYVLDLKKIETEYSNLEICYANILDIHRIWTRDAIQGTSVLPTLFENIEVKNWEEEPVIKLIAPLSPLTGYGFLRNLFKQVAHSTGIFTCGRMEVFPFINDYEYLQMTSNPKCKDYWIYKKCTVLYHSFFEIQHLHTFSWQIFAPEVITTHKTIRRGDPKVCHLVKLTPRKDLHSKYDPSILPAFIFFVTQATMKQSNYVIAFFEKLMPGCGPKLIKLGIPLFAKFGELEPDSYLQLFAEISEWDEFKESGFFATMSGREYEEIS